MQWATTGRVVVSEQNRAIGHGHLNVACDHDVMGFGWWQVSPFAQETAEESHASGPFLLLRTRSLAKRRADSFCY